MKFLLDATFSGIACPKTYICQKKPEIALYYSELIQKWWSENIEIDLLSFLYQ